MARRNGGTDNQGTASPAVTQAIERAFRPLVELLLHQGVGLPVVVDMLKEIYVQVAEQTLSGVTRGASDSRISLMTGVHRKDVRRLRRAPRAESRPPLAVVTGAQVVAQWWARAEFRDGRGRPARLPRMRRDGGARSFEALAESVTRDVGPRALLDELLRLGVVRLDGKDRVALESGAFTPRRSVEEKAYYLGKNLHDHAAAAVRNLKGGAEPLLDRAVHYVALSPESAEVLARLAERSGMRALSLFNREAAARKQRDRKRGAGGRRVHFGVYFYTDDDAK